MEQEQQQPPVAVTGATGKTGRRVVAHLRARGRAVRPLSRRTAQRFAWDDEAGWPRALAGTSAAYLVVPDGVPEASTRAGRFAQVAADAGLERLVLLSASIVARRDEHPELARGWAEVEDAVTAVGVPTTVLRPTWFQQGFSEDLFAPQIRRGVLRLPAGDLREALIDAGDIAEVAAAALTSPTPWDRALSLSGPRVVSFREVADLVGEALGRPVRYEEVPDEVFVAELTRDGYPPDAAAGVVPLFDLLRGDPTVWWTDEVERVLGRPARDVAVHVADLAASGVWDQPAAA